MDEKTLISQFTELLDKQTEQVAKLMDVKLTDTKEEILRHVSVVVEGRYDTIRKLLQEDYLPVAALARDAKYKLVDYPERDFPSLEGYPEVH